MKHAALDEKNKNKTNVIVRTLIVLFDVGMNFSAIEFFNVNQMLKLSKSENY